MPLFELVRANPTDRAARAVLADALTAAGDPRGVFITLQLLGGEDAQRKANGLLRRHLDVWLGPLEPFVVKRSVVFEAGFPASAKVRARSAEVARAAGQLPEWFSFTELRFETREEASAARSFFGPSMRALERASGVDPVGLGQLLELSTPPPLVSLSASMDGLDCGPVIERLPTLRSLRITDAPLEPRTLERVFQRGPWLRRLAIDRARLSLEEARLVLSSAPPALEQVVLGPVTWVKADGEWRPHGPGVL